jgi:hypothetical protein
MIALIKEAAHVNDTAPICTQLDISANSVLSNAQASSAGHAEQTMLLRELVATQQKSNELLGQLVALVSQQQRQRAAELKAWREANPKLAESCRHAAESLSKVHTEFLSSIASEAASSGDDLLDSDYALGEFIDRYGPRLAHFNGIMQLFAQLGAPGQPDQSP